MFLKFYFSLGFLTAIFNLLYGVYYLYRYGGIDAIDGMITGYFMLMGKDTYMKTLGKVGFLGPNQKMFLLRTFVIIWQFVILSLLAIVFWPIGWGIKIYNKIRFSNMTKEKSLQSRE